MYCYYYGNYCDFCYYYNELVYMHRLWGFGQGEAEGCATSTEVPSAIDAEAKRLLRRRTALYDELGRFCDARRALAGAGVPRLYLANPVAPTEKCEIKQGGATSCARLLAEIAALESLLLKYRR